VAGRPVGNTRVRVPPAATLKIAHGTLVPTPVELVLAAVSSYNLNHTSEPVLAELSTWRNFTFNEEEEMSIAVLAIWVFEKYRVPLGKEAIVGSL
jgi:hypothetical protein